MACLASIGYGLRALSSGRPGEATKTAKKRVIIPRQPGILCICFATCLHLEEQVSYFCGFPNQKVCIHSYTEHWSIVSTPKKVSHFHPLAKFSTIPMWYLLLLRFAVRNIILSRTTYILSPFFTGICRVVTRPHVYSSARMTARGGRGAQAVPPHPIVHGVGRGGVGGGQGLSFVLFPFVLSLVRFHIFGTGLGGGQGDACTVPLRAVCG